MNKCISRRAVMGQCNVGMQFGMVDVVERREEEETGGRKGNMVQTQSGVGGKRQLHNDCQATTRASTWQEVATRSRKVQARQHPGI
jgi:hypothetical protein